MSELRYFQYIGGERKGDVLVFDTIEQEDGMVFVCFKDGSRCNEEFILPLNETNWEGKLIAEISDPSNTWTIKKEWVGRTEEKYEKNEKGEMVCVQPFVAGREKITLTPPRKTTSKFGSVNASPIVQPVQQSHVNSNDPVWVMMDKAKKFDTPVPMELVISLPAKSLYNVAKESFEEGGEKVIDYIIKNLDDSKLKASLRTALFYAYEESEINKIDNQQQKVNDAKLLNTHMGVYEPDTVDAAVVGEPKLKNNETKDE